MTPPEPCPLGPATFLLDVDGCLLNSTSHRVLGSKFWRAKVRKEALKAQQPHLAFTMQLKESQCVALTGSDIAEKDHRRCLSACSPGGAGKGEITGTVSAQELGPSHLDSNPGPATYRL